MERDCSIYILTQFVQFDYNGKFSRFFLCNALDAVMDIKEISITFQCLDAVMDIKNFN